MSKLQATEQGLPVRSELIAWSEFIALADCPEETVLELMEIGWMSPAQSASEGDLYHQSDVYRVRKLGRICEDFELPTLAGAIIVDLLQRISVLERRLCDLSNRQP